MEKVRKALGRTQTPTSVATPPMIDDTVARLVARDVDLVQTFIRTATEARFKLIEVAEADVSAGIIESIQLHQCHRIGIPDSPLFDRLNLPAALQTAGLGVERWDRSTLDSAYDLDCGITDVYAAIAETGSLVIRPGPAHGRALSLVPPLHIAVVEPGQILPDLIDLFAKLSAEPSFPNTTIITGPSKTADIEGSLVTGVHGPGVVEIYLLK
jgi:L-lactate dehydrogenase complex protein LldG